MILKFLNLLTLFFFYEITLIKKVITDEDKVISYNPK